MQPIKNDLANVHALPGVRPPSQGPNTALVEALQNLLAKAESGELQSFIGTGYTSCNGRLAIWVDLHDNIYEMLGSLSWLQHEYVERHTRGLD